MKERVENAAKLIAGFNGTLKSANDILDQLSEITRQIKSDSMELQRESDVIDGLSHYILAKRNELAHDEPKKIEQVQTLIDVTHKQERVDAVLDAVLTIVNDNILVFTMDDIRHQLEKMRINLGVSNPSAVIATILSADKRFKKNAMGRYEYIGEDTHKIRIKDTKVVKRVYVKKLNAKDVMPKERGVTP